MAKRFNLGRLFFLMTAIGAVSLSDNAMAAAFQLWEMDAASIGNYHAGTAAIADDASTAMYNPAGLIRLKNQQIILGADPILTDFQYKGTVRVNTLINPATGLPAVQPVTVQGGGFNLVPFGHYAAPISDRFAFGMSVDVPFGLKTDYGSATAARYVATLTKLQVVDYSPSLGIALNDKFSVGFGLDIQRLSAEFDQYTTLGALGFAPADTFSQNQSSDTGYGYRVGALYQFSPQTRAGINFRSKVTHHTSGNSYFTGPLAENGISQQSNNFEATATLPSVTSASIFHSLNNCWDIMGSIAYTQWSVFKDVVFVNAAGINAAGVNSNAVIVNINQHYHNVWNYSVGANYHPNERWILRSGLGFDESPTNDTYRNLQLPDSDRIAVAFGGHYQATRAIGFDLGYTHIFAMNTRLNNVTQVLGPEVIRTNGSVSASADVFGAQLVWNIV